MCPVEWELVKQQHRDPYHVNITLIDQTKAIDKRRITILEKIVGGVVISKFNGGFSEPFLLLLE